MDVTRALSLASGEGASLYTPRSVSVLQPADKVNSTVPGCHMAAASAVASSLNSKSIDEPEQVTLLMPEMFSRRTPTAPESRFAGIDVV